MSAADLYGQGEGTLSRAADLVTLARTDLDQIAVELGGRLAELQTRWQGAGATAFLAFHEAWDARQRQIVGALEDFATALRATERDNLGTDEAQSAVYARAAQAL